MTFFYVAIGLAIGVVALGFLRTLRRIYAIARGVEDPEKLAQRIRTAIDAAGIDGEGARIEVKVERAPREPLAQPLLPDRLLPDRPTPVLGLSVGLPGRGGSWLLAFAVAGALAWAVLELI